MLLIKLDDLYHTHYKPLELEPLKSSVGENHKILISHLSKEDRKIVLRIIDALEMICNYQSKNSFIQGFKLGCEITYELQNYSSQLYEIDTQKAGSSFMSQEVQKDEEEN